MEKCRSSKCRRKFRDCRIIAPQIGQEAGCSDIDRDFGSSLGSKEKYEKQKDTHNKEPIYKRIIEYFVHTIWISFFLDLFHWWSCYCCGRCIAIFCGTCHIECCIRVIHIHCMCDIYSSFDFGNFS